MTCATGSVSCPSGTTVCSAQDNSGVTCNGTFIACPTTPPACAGLPSCDLVRPLKAWASLRATAVEVTGAHPGG